MQRPIYKLGRFHPYARISGFARVKLLARMSILSAARREEGPCNASCDRRCGARALRRTNCVGTKLMRMPMMRPKREENL
jgi:hypothetical protein